jgi:4-amino-4-deoxy-L-arabinose transferase-like glycosyltransferase
MTLKNSISWSWAGPALFSAVFCIIMAVAGITNRPLFPVDETRYLTVAWEMFSRHDWLLPTLNFEPYHHKPPLLFWIIMSAWSVFGVSQIAAMIVPYLIAFTVCALTIRMTRVMVPDKPRLPFLTIAVMLGSLAFVLYGNLIMFDMLLSIFVVLGITSIWQFSKSGQWIYILLFALAVGGGVLSKGPVVLLHLLFPVVLARFWIGQRVMSWRKWSGAFLSGILAGAAIALSWAIPAAIAGGPEFTEKIFWGQTAGRVSSSFDHQHPVWWYLPFLPLFGLPWLLHGGIWKGLSELKNSPGSASSLLRFLACWLIPVFISFSFISGKQVHYLLPLIPGLSLFLALAFDRARDRATPAQALPAILVCAILALIPALASWFAQPIENLDPERIHISETLGQISAPVSVTICALILISGVLMIRRGLDKQIAAIALSMLAFISCFLLEAGRGYFKNYDLAPMASVVQQLPDTPLAFVRNYHGEWGFLARLNRPVKQIDINDVPEWFKQNPDGLIFIRTRRPEEYSSYDVIFSMPYKMTATYVLAAPRGAGKHFTFPHP